MIAFRTVSGRRLNLDNPQPNDFDIRDIACALSKCCRFAGQVGTFYSVAQHSCLVAQLVERPFKLAALLHDATEAYVGDLSRNIKHHPSMKAYRVLEAEIAQAIAERFGLLPDDEVARHQVKRADDLLACYEHLILRTEGGFSAGALGKLIEEGFVRRKFTELSPLFPRLPWSLDVESPTEAEAHFLNDYVAYSRQARVLSPGA